jgi:hypothetical protein
MRPQSSFDSEQRGTVAWLIVAYLLSHRAITDRQYQKAARAAIKTALKQARRKSR